MTRSDVETALDAGRLKCRMANGSLWSCRRNGRTKTWKTRPNDFSIPIKIGFKTYGHITPQSIDSDELAIV